MQDGLLLVISSHGCCHAYVRDDGEKEHANAKKILLNMGEFFQIQDDFLDLFGDPSVTGKIGTDIQDNKCSWLVVQCLQQASPEQRKVLQVLGRPWILELPGKGAYKDSQRGLAASADIFLS